MEAGLQCSNKIHRHLLCLAGESYEASDGPVWYVPLDLELQILVGILVPPLSTFEG